MAESARQNVEDAESADNNVVVLRRDEDDGSLVSRALAVPGAREIALPEVYQQCREYLEKCTRLNECTHLMTRMAQMAIEAKAAQDESFMILARRVRNEALRRLGLLAAELPNAVGGRVVPGAAANKVPFEQTRTGVAEAAGVSHHTLSKAIRFARIPDSIFSEINNAPESATEEKILQVERSLRPTDQYQSAAGILRANTVRLLGSLTEFTQRHQPQDLARVFPMDRLSVAASIERQIQWLQHFAQHLRGRRS